MKVGISIRAKSSSPPMGMSPIANTKKYTQRKRRRHTLCTPNANTGGLKVVITWHTITTNAPKQKRAPDVSTMSLSPSEYALMSAYISRRRIRMIDTSALENVMDPKHTIRLSNTRRVLSDVTPKGWIVTPSLWSMPTFIYIGIFLQIILPCYRFFFRREITKRALGTAVACAMLVNWLIFAALMIIMASTASASEGKNSCDCQISDLVSQNNAAQIVRIVYKSIVLVIAIGVVIVTFLFRTQAERAGGIQEIYYPILLLSFCLFLDCAAFVTYYAVNVTTAYFLIVLWFTELLPICVMNGGVTWATRTLTLNFI